MLNKVMGWLNYIFAFIKKSHNYFDDIIIQIIIIFNHVVPIYLKVERRESF